MALNLNALRSTVGATLSAGDAVFDFQQEVRAKSSSYFKVASGMFYSHMGLQAYKGVSRESISPTPRLSAARTIFDAIGVVETSDYVLNGRVKEDLAGISQKKGFSKVQACIQFVSDSSNHLGNACVARDMAISGGLFTPGKVSRIVADTPVGKFFGQSAANATTAFFVTSLALSAINNTFTALKKAPYHFSKLSVSEKATSQPETQLMRVFTVIYEAAFALLVLKSGQISPSKEGALGTGVNALGLLNNTMASQRKKEIESANEEQEVKSSLRRGSDSLMKEDGPSLLESMTAQFKHSFSVIQSGIGHVKAFTDAPSTVKNMLEASSAALQLGTLTADRLSIFSDRSVADSFQGFVPLFTKPLTALKVCDTVSYFWKGNFHNREGRFDTLGFTRQVFAGVANTIETATFLHTIKAVDFCAISASCGKVPVLRSVVALIKDVGPGKIKGYSAVVGLILLAYPAFNSIGKRTESSKALKNKSTLVLASATIGKIFTGSNAKGAPFALYKLAAASASLVKSYAGRS